MPFIYNQVDLCKIICDLYFAKTGAAELGKGVLWIPTTDYPILSISFSFDPEFLFTVVALGVHVFNIITWYHHTPALTNVLAQTMLNSWKSLLHYIQSVKRGSSLCTLTYLIVAHVSL